MLHVPLHIVKSLRQRLNKQLSFYFVETPFICITKKTRFLQAIAIQIHNPLVSENSPAPSVIDKPLSAMKTNKGEQRLSQTYTALVRPVNQTQLLKVTPTLIDFSEVEVNKASCK